MNKKDILNDFKHLNFNRVSKKQKKKAQDFIINSLDGKYKMNIQPKWYKFFFFILWKKCYNIESENREKYSRLFFGLPAAKSKFFVLLANHKIHSFIEA